MSLNINTIQGIIWDLDNTLYHFTDKFYRSCTVAAAKAAQEQGISLNYEDTLKLAERSEQTYGYSMHGYVVEHGIAYADLHFPFHEKIDESVVGVIEGLKEIFSSFEISSVILTNASRGWATRVLNHIDMKEFFADNMIFAMEDADFEPKASSEKGFRLAAGALNIPFENILMVDDLDRNLKIPHNLGMQTAYLHYGDEIEGLEEAAAPSYITAQYYNSVDLIENLNCQKSEEKTNRVNSNC